MNVGLSRAKCCLVIVGDAKTLITDANWEKVVKYSIREGVFYKFNGEEKEYFEKFKKGSEEFRIRNEKYL